MTVFDVYKMIVFGVGVARYCDNDNAMIKRSSVQSYKL